MSKNDIFIISDNKDIANSTISKILLSRKNDKLSFFNYNSAFEKIMNKNPALVIVHVENEEHIPLIKKIKSNYFLKNTTVIMISDYNNGDLLCKGFDNGIDDFIDINSNDTILNMRIIWALKNKTVYDNSVRKSELLAFSKITEKETDIYTKEFTKKIFEIDYQKFLTNYNNAIFMILSPDIKCRKEISVQDIGKILKLSLRTTDIAGYTEDKIYLLCSNTDYKGTKKIFEKINNRLPFDYSVSASATEISLIENFNDAEKTLISLLQKALKEENSLLLFDEKQRKNNGIIKNTQNNTKTNNSKIEKMLLPIFFKMQSIYEHKLFDTDFKQLFYDNESCFIIKNRERLDIISFQYENQDEISIEIKETYQQKTKSKKITLPIKKLTEEKVENIIQKIAEKFRQKSYKKEN